MAVGWILLIAPDASADAPHRAHELGFAGEFLADARFALELVDAALVAQQPQDFVDVHHASGFFSSALRRSRSLCSCLSVAAFFSQVALSSMGKMPVYRPGSRMERETKDPAEMLTRSPMVRCPRIIAAPPI